LGAIAELVEDGRTGFHFQAGKAEDLARVIDLVQTSTSQLASMKKWRSAVAAEGGKACFDLARHFSRMGRSPDQLTRELVYDWLDRTVILGPDILCRV